MEFWRQHAKYSNLKVVTRGNSNLHVLFALTKNHNQNNAFASVLALTYTIICPTTAEKEISMRYSVCFPPKEQTYGVIRTSIG